MSRLGPCMQADETRVVAEAQARLDNQASVLKDKRAALAQRLKVREAVCCEEGKEGMQAVEVRPSR